MKNRAMEPRLKKNPNTISSRCSSRRGASEGISPQRIVCVCGSSGACGSLSLGHSFTVHHFFHILAIWGGVSKRWAAVQSQVTAFTDGGGGVAGGAGPPSWPHPRSQAVVCVCVCVYTSESVTSMGHMRTTSNSSPLCNTATTLSNFKHKYSWWGSKWENYYNLGLRDTSVNGFITF